jgi:hypothetical protein
VPIGLHRLALTPPEAAVSMPTMADKQSLDKWQ